MRIIVFAVTAGWRLEVALVEPLADRPPAWTRVVGVGRRSAERPLGAISIAGCFGFGGHPFARLRRRIPSDGGATASAIAQASWLAV